MISGVFWVAATKALAQAITWLITIVVVRLLSPQDYGLMGMAVLFTSFLLLFNDLGLGAAIIQDADLDDDRLAHLRSAILSINVILFFSLIVLAPVVARYFREPALVDILRVLGIAFVLNGIGAPSGYMLARELSFKKKSRAEFFGSMGGGMSTLAFAWTGFGVWSLVAGHLCQQLAVNTLYCFYRPIKLRAFSLAKIRRSMNFGFQVASGSVLWYVSSNADFMVVGRVLGRTALGFYGLAFQFASLPIEKIVTVVTQVAFPSFATVQNDLDTLRRYYLKLVGTIALVTFPIFLGLFLVADSAVRVLLTPEWLPVVLPLKILCIVSCLRAIETMNAPLILARGRPRVALLNNLLQAIVLPIAFYAGARAGIAGVSIGWLIAWPILYLIVTSQTLHLVGLTFTPYVAEVRHAVVGSTLMLALVLFVQKSVLADASALANLMVSGTLGSAVYVAYNALFNMSAIQEGLALVQRRRVDASATNVAAAEDLATGTPASLVFGVGSVAENPSLIEVK
jgi:teichuronic acid exporter